MRIDINIDCADLDRMVDFYTAALGYVPHGSLGETYRSLMPGDYATRLSAGEISNLVAYLRTLNARDLTKTSAAPLTGGLTFDRIRDSHAEPHNWLTYWGDYHATHFSTLKQITAENVAQLQAKWAIQLPGASTIEATPLVIDGVMYTSGQPGTLLPSSFQM